MIDKQNLKPILHTVFYVCLGIILLYIVDYIIILVTKNTELQLTNKKTVYLYIIFTAIILYFILYFYSKKNLECNVELIRANRLLKVLSNANQILIRTKDETKFLKEICQLLVKNAGYKMVWIGFKENDNEKSVRPVTSCGFEEGYIKNIKISWGDNEYGRGPTGTAIRTGKSVVEKSIEKSSNYKPWVKEAKKRGYSSSGAFPIKVEDEVLGTLNVYSSYNLFDKEEIKLLENLALNIGYGIQERKQRQKLKENYEKLKEIDKIKSNFLSIVSHELRTPLTPIKGTVEILYRDHKNIKNMTDYIEIMRNNILRLQNIINNLVDLSTLEEGRIKLNKKNNDLIEIIEKTINDMKSLIEKNKIKIIKEYEHNKLLLYCDEYKIEQVIMSLIDNAIKYSNANSEINIKVFTKYGKEINLPQYVEKKVFPEKLYSVVCIKDSGMGIEKDKLNKIFENFYQTDDVLSRRGSGLGIGLSISKHVIEHHNGIIWAESEGKEKGSCFCFALPH